MQSNSWCSILVISLCLVIFGESNGASHQIDDGSWSPLVVGLEPHDNKITLTAFEATQESDHKSSEDPKASGGDSKDSQLGGHKPQTATPSTEIRRLKEQIIEMQNKGKLGFRKVVLCSSVEGYGVYSPIEPGQSSPKVYLYFEPENVSTLVTGDRYIIDLSVDLFLYDAGGKLVAGKETIFRINKVSRSPIFDVFYKIELNLKKPSNQKTVLKTVLHDKIKNSSVSSAYKLNVQSAGKKNLEPI